MTDREKIIAWLKDDAARVAAFRTIKPKCWVLLEWHSQLYVPKIANTANQRDVFRNDDHTFVLSPSGPWEPTPGRVVWRGTGFAFGEASDDADLGRLCESAGLPGKPQHAMLLDIALCADFIAAGTPFTVTIEADE